MSKESVWVILLFILVACNQAPLRGHLDERDTVMTAMVSPATPVMKADSSGKKKEVEERMLDTIFKLTEVTQRAAFIEKQTKGKRFLRVWMADTPHVPDQKYYWIKVGEDNGTNLVTHFNFYVYPDSMRIMYYDVPADTVLTLSHWRKTNGR